MDNQEVRASYNQIAWHKLSKSSCQVDVCAQTLKKLKPKLFLVSYFKNALHFFFFFFLFLNFPKIKRTIKPKTRRKKGKKIPILQFLRKQIRKINNKSETFPILIVQECVAFSCLIFLNFPKIEWTIKPKTGKKNPVLRFLRK